MKFSDNKNNAKGNTMTNLNARNFGFGMMALVLVAALITGCGGDNTPQASNENNIPTQQAAYNPASQTQIQGTNANQAQHLVNNAQFNQQPNTVGLNFVRFTDPTQRAFTVDVPQGWTNQGGTAGIKHEVSSLSPDGMILVQNGDVSLPTYMEPSAWQPATAPGQCRDVYGFCMEVRPFVNGIQFAADYVGQKFSQVCQNLTFTGQRKRPDWEQYLGQILQVDQVNASGSGMQMGLDAGEVGFACTLNGQQMRGTYLFVNRVVRIADGMGGHTGSWEPFVMSGFIAPEHQTETAQAVLNRTQMTFKLDQNWLNAQSRANRQSMQQRASVLDNSTGGNSYSDSFDRHNQMMRGTVNLYNSETGETHYNENDTSNYYWQNSGGVYGTDLNETSDVFVTPLERQY